VARRLGTAVTVPPFDRDASVALLTSQVADLDRSAADLLAHLLGDLPLAVDQAAGFLDETALPVAEYTRLLTARLEQMLDQGSVLDRVDTTMANLWTLSVDRLRIDQPAAVELLELCALCDADPIPLDLFAATPDALTSGALAEAVRMPDRWAATVGALAGYNLARRDGDQLTVHRLVAASTRRALPPDVAAERLATLTSALRSRLPGEIRGKPENWAPWRGLLAHVLTVADRALQATGLVFEDGMWLTAGAATFLRELGQVADAIPLLQRLAASRERALGPDHPGTLYAHSLLGDAHMDAGHLAKAEAVHTTVLAAREGVLGAEHPETLVSRIRLASLCQENGRFNEAITRFVELVADQERILGADHPQTLLSRGFLAGAYTAAGRTDLAVREREADLGHRERVLGADHPTTLYARSSLAGAYQKAGRTTEAIVLFESVAADRARLLGPDHPTTLLSRSLLAGAYRAAGRHQDAIALWRNVLSERADVLGADHPETLRTRSFLAGALQEAGQLAEAVDLFEQSFADRRRVLGPGHPGTARSRTLLARAYNAAGRATDAAALRGRSGPGQPESGIEADQPH